MKMIFKSVCVLSLIVVCHGAPQDLGDSENTLGSFPQGTIPEEPINEGAAAEKSVLPYSVSSQYNETSSSIPIISQSEELEPNGTYKFSYETGNGIKFEESSYEKKASIIEGRSLDSEHTTPADYHVQEGSYSYISPDGTVISLRYIADENGFQPIGDHLPTSPPVPEAIQKLLQNQSSKQESLDREALSSAAGSIVEGTYTPENDVSTVPE